MTSGRSSCDIDTNGDLVEDLRYRLRFSGPGGDGHQHPELFRQTGTEARSLAGARLVGGANLGDTQQLPEGGRVWAGIAGDAFSANAPAYFEFFGGIDKTGKADFGVFDKPFDLFDGRNVLDIVLVGFNIGVELGQLSILAVAIPLGAALARTRFRAPAAVVREPHPGRSGCGGRRRTFARLIERR